MQNVHRQRHERVHGVLKTRWAFDYEVIHICMCDKCLYYEQNEYSFIVLSVACPNAMTI